MSAKSVEEESSSNEPSKTSRCVFVANVPDKATTDEVKELLSKAGTIVKLSFFKDPKTNRRRGYGNCIYEDAESAQRAVLTLNNYELKGQAICVKRPQKKKKISAKADSGKTKTKKKESHTNDKMSTDTEKETKAENESQTNDKQPDEGADLLISGLPESIDSDQLKEMLSSFGTVVSAQVTQQPNSDGCCNGAVTMASRDQCDEVIATFDGAKLPDSEQQLTVKYTEEKSKSEESRKRALVTSEDMHQCENPNKLTLYIAGLDTSIEADDLKTMFSPFGCVQSSRILRNFRRISRGVGFVEMETREECDKIIESFNGTSLPDGKGCLTVQYAVRKSDLAKGNGAVKRQKTSGQDDDVYTLYISGLPPTTTVADLEEMFSTFGNVMEARLLRDSRPGADPGVGFVDMRRLDECQNIIKVFNGTSLPGSDGCLSVQLANKQTDPTQSQLKTITTIEEKPDGQRRLFIAGLPSRIRIADLRMLVSPYGDVISTKIGPNRESALIEMATQSQSENVIAGLNNSNLPDSKCTLTVRYATMEDDPSEGNTIATRQEVLARGPLIRPVIDGCKEPLVGLTYVMEFHDGIVQSYDNLWFMCQLCFCKMTSNGFLTHMLGIRHRCNYLMRYHPAMVQEIRALSPSHDKINDLLTKCARRAEILDGRRTVKIRYERGVSSKVQADKACPRTGEKHRRQKTIPEHKLLGISWNSPRPAAPMSNRSQILHDDNYGDGQFPGGRFPGGQFPGGRFPGGRFPGGRFPDGRFPGRRFPGGQFPRGRFPNGQPDFRMHARAAINNSGNFGGDFGGNFGGNIRGNFGGNVPDNFGGNSRGNFGGDVSGNFAGNVCDNFGGNVCDNFGGNVRGNIGGNVGFNPATMVRNEDEAQMALEVSNQLTQALIQYRMNKNVPGGQMGQGFNDSMMAPQIPSLVNQGNWQNRRQFNYN